MKHSSLFWICQQFKLTAFYLSPHGAFRLIFVLGGWKTERCDRAPCHDFVQFSFRSFCIVFQKKTSSSNETLGFFVFLCGPYQRLMNVAFSRLLLIGCIWSLVGSRERHACITFIAKSKTGSIGDSKSYKPIKFCASVWKYEWELLFVSFSHLQGRVGFLYFWVAWLSFQTKTFFLSCSLDVWAEFFFYFLCSIEGRAFFIHY